MYESEIALAVKSLSKPGGVIVVPTDTTYGVVCNLRDIQAVDRIYELKGRDRSKPLIILGSNSEDLVAWISGDQAMFLRLAQRFWPGPLTIVAKVAPKTPSGILSGGTTVGLRIPDHPAVRELIDQLPDKSVASTSANLSGTGSPRLSEQVTASIGHLVDFVMPDCGRQPDGTESTIIDITRPSPVVLRSGALDPQTVLDFFAKQEPNPMVPD